MIRSAWFKMPSTWMRNEGLREFKWSNDQLGAPAAKIAALQIYYSIAMSLEFVEMRGAYDMKINRYVSTATFNRFRALTGLSRALITAGVEVLERAGLIKRYREGKRCFYEIVGYVP
ncbi:helix-turn-helix domain-containing protein [Enterobacter asburiae]|nr:helix-turn-helix domain-containing protein [Enterobacter asburiae]